MTDFSQWPAQEPPEGFSVRVLAARRRRPRVRIAAAAMALAAAALVAALFLPGTESGSADTRQRSSIPVGRRAVAVAEAGARLHWTVSSRGHVRLSQETGDVFYRVEPGADFEVESASARVLVQGTCFRVEVVMSSAAKMMLSAAAGAAAASAVLVTVYEGKVSVAGPAGTVEVAAGEQARVEPGAAPRLAADGSASKAPHAAARPEEVAPAPVEALVKTQRAQIVALQSRVRELEKTGATVKPATAARDDPPPDPPGLHQRYRDFTRAELLSMAQNCEVRAELPPVGREPYHLNPDLGARLHLSEEEQAGVTTAVDAVGKDVVAHLRALYLEATGDAVGADSLEPVTLGQEILHKSPQAVVLAARTRVARERAGLETPPADPNSGSIAERYFRYLITVGDSFQRALEPALGAQHAGTVRDNLVNMRMNMDGCSVP